MHVLHLSSFIVRRAGPMLGLLLVAGALVAVSAAEIAGPARNFQGDYPAGCSAEEARAIFERHMRTLSAEQRAAIGQLADELERELKGDQAAAAQDQTPTTLNGGSPLLAILRSASDAETAMLLAMQQRSRLSARDQQRVATIVERLSPLVKEAARAKLTYQPYFAEKVRQRWEFLDQSSKREMFRAYSRLAGEEPDWLLLPRDKAHPPLPPSTAGELDSLEERLKDRLRSAEREFQPQRDGFLARLRTAKGATSLAEAERRAIESIERLLDADYGKGFRGMMLLEPDPELPTSLREEATVLCKAYRAELDHLRRERASELGEFKAFLAPRRKTHLKQGEFAELLATDIRLDELKQLLRPMRILAHREPGIEWPEEVLLLDVRDAEFRVHFLRDEHEAWLPRSQVLLKPSSTTIRGELALHAPADGPGTPLTDRTVLYEGQTLMGYHNRTWYPVTVIDVSPFGVVINWQGFRDSYQLKPKNELRILSDR